MCKTKGIVTTAFRQGDRSHAGVVGTGTLRTSTHNSTPELNFFFFLFFKFFQPLGQDSLVKQVYNLNGTFLVK